MDAAPKTKAETKPVTGNFPVPGGPMQQRPSPVREALMQELTQAGITARNTAQSLGVSMPQERSVVPLRGIKVANKIVAQAELDENMRLQSDAINDYVRSAGYTDMYSTSIAKNYLTDRLNTMRMKLIKVANDFDKKLAKQKVAEEKRRAFAANLGSIAGIATMGIVSGGNPFAMYAGAQAGEKIGTVGA